MNWSKSLEDCHHNLKEAFPKGQTLFGQAYPKCSLKLDYTYRSPEVQLNEVYSKGRKLVDGKWIEVDPKLIVTHVDGTTKKSHHNVYPSQAADIYIVENDKILWPPDNSNSSPEAQRVRNMYVELGKIWDGLGLISGATWRYGWKDWPHIQCAYEII